ncbi:OmpA family protein [Luminiphilus sp.]|nr:OmpA family protein [Luminiphilus sp.]
MADEDQENNEVVATSEDAVEIDFQQDSDAETSSGESPETPVKKVAAEPEDDGPVEDCPPCKSGAPAWMATFADMATLLMAFFVLILSFAQMNVPKFKEVAGSMNDSMGVQRQVPVVEPPTADSIIATQFMKAKVEPTAMSTISEQTTDDPQPQDVELKVTTSPSDTSTSSDLEKVKQALKDEIARGQVSVTEVDGKISVALTGDIPGSNHEGDKGEQSGSKLDESEIAIFAKVVNAQAQVSSEVQVSKSPSSSEMSVVATSNGKTPQSNDAATSEFEEIKSRLTTEISQGRVNVEMVDDEIKITLADQGSFVSGSADLRSGFYPVLESVGAALKDRAGLITVAGHTDSIPVAFSQRFQSNWDLSVSRSASVVDYLVGDGFIEAGKVTVTGFADTIPIASNDSAAGRAQNRRIEIKVKTQG